MTLTCPQTCCCCCCCCCCCWCGDDYEWPRCFRVRPAGTYDSDLTITINLHCIASETYDPSTPIHIYPIFVLNVFLQTRPGACCTDWRKRVTWSVGKISQHVVLRLLLLLLQCTWWESAYFTFCARALFARVCCRLYKSNWWPGHNARTSAQRPIRARKPGNYFITGSCGKIPRDLRTTELIAIFTPWHLLCFPLFMLAVINLEFKCGSVVEICFSTNSDWFGNQKNLLGG